MDHLLLKDLFPAGQKACREEILFSDMLLKRAVKCRQQKPSMHELCFY